MGYRQPRTLSDDRAELACMARLLLCHPFGDVFFNLAIDVSAELIIQLLLNQTAAKERSHASGAV